MYTADRVFCTRGTGLKSRSGVGTWIRASDIQRELAKDVPTRIATQIRTRRPHAPRYPG